MNKIFVLALLAVMVICSCQVNEENEFAPEGKSFTATMEAFACDATAVDTKTSLDANLNVLWNQGDQVSLFAGSTINERYQATDDSDGKTVAALNPVGNTGLVNGEQISGNVAFYPYTSTAAIAQSGSNYVISDIELPAIQDYEEDSFGNGAFPMAAATGSTSDHSLKFMNVLGGLKLLLTGTACITSISVTDNDYDALCGPAFVTVSNTGSPTITLTEITDNTETVTLDCGGGVQLDEETATAFIIALPPMTMIDGFTVNITDSEGDSMEIKTTKSQTIARSNLLKMPAVFYIGGAVDLGLTSGLKWASRNLGATVPEEYGDYYAWGETAPYYSEGHSQDNPCYSWEYNKTGYYWDSYSLCDGSYSSITKYCTKESAGTVDDITVLDPEDDAASVNWQGTWRMPTVEEWDELIDECTWTWTTQDGVVGMTVTGPNNNSIFLPAAGYRYGNSLYDAGSLGHYWSSSLDTRDSNAAKSCSFPAHITKQYRVYGRPVRPVTE